MTEIDSCLFLLSGGYREARCNWSRAREIGSSGMVDDDRPSVREGLDRMADIARHDRNQARSRDLGHAIDGHLELALDHLIDFFLGMEVFVYGRAAREGVVCECHARRVEIASEPAREALDNVEAAGVDKGHKIVSRKNASTAGLVQR